LERGDGIAPISVGTGLARPPVKDLEQRRVAPAAVEAGPAEVADFGEAPGAGFDGAFDVTVPRSGAEANDHGSNLPVGAIR